MSSEEQKQQVRRRRVFYITGYDPIHPRRYRELYRKEGAAQSEVSGYALELKPKTTKGPYGWHVRSEQDGVQVETDVEVLYWSDIVRDSMSNSIPLTYLRMARTAWIYIGSGVLGRLMRMRKGPVIAALYPVVMMILYLVVAVALGWGAASLVMLADPWLPKLLLQLVGLGFAIVVVAVVLRWFRAQDGRIYTYYLVHNYIYSAQFHGANPPEFEARIAEFVAAIAAAMQEDVDEVLVVGHSSGAHLGCVGSGRFDQGWACACNRARAELSHTGPCDANGVVPAQGRSAAQGSELSLYAGRADLGRCNGAG